MTTFTLVNSESVAGDPATINLNAVGSTDNILFAIMNERDGTGHAPHTVTDGNGTWIKIIGEDQEIGNPSFRHSASLWWRKAVSADTSAAFDVTGDDGTANSKRLSIFEIDPSGAYDWTFQVQSSDNTGTGSTSPLSSGSTADPGGSDLFSIGFATWRPGTGTPTGIAFTNLDSGVTSFLDTSLTHAIEFTSTGEASGAKSTSVSWSGSGHEAICGIAVFSGGAAPSGPPTGTLQMMGLGI